MTKLQTLKRELKYSLATYWLFKNQTKRPMKRNDLKEISDNEFVAILGMMQNEHFLVDWDKYELNEQVDSDFERCQIANEEFITDETGQVFYLINFLLATNVRTKLVDFDPYDNGWCDILESFYIRDIELKDLNLMQINTTAEQRLKMATIIQERLTIKS